jgi:acyl carrier protein
MSGPFIPTRAIRDEEILGGLAAIVAESLGVDRARVTPDTSLDALGAESIDVVEITFEVEHAFTVLMPERSILELAAEVAGPGVFEQGGVLTEEGCELLRARMPELTHAPIAPGTRVADLTPSFLRVDVWARLVRGLIDASPRECPRCGGGLVQGSPARVRCPTCQVEQDLPTGDALGREWVQRWMATPRA